MIQINVLPTYVKTIKLLNVSSPLKHFNFEQIACEIG